MKEVTLYKAFFLGCKPRSLAYWNSRWVQFFVPIWLNWGPKRNKAYDGVYHDWDTIPHVSLLYFEKTGEYIKSIYIDNLTSKNKKGKIWHEDKDRVEAVITKVKERLHIEAAQTLWHPVKWNQSRTPDCCTVFHIHSILALLEAGKYSPDQIDAYHGEKSMEVCLTSRLKQFNAKLEIFY